MTGQAADIAHREARIMARVTEDGRVKGRTPGEALAIMADLVRYTFEYPADAYTDGVHADIERLWREGYSELAVRNYWTSPFWLGISSTWREPGGGQLFEVQFHTPESRAARDQTYPDYLRLRSAATSDAERGTLLARLRDQYAGALASSAPATEKERAERELALDTEAARARARYFRARPGPLAAERISYYSISDAYSGEDSPAGVLRRVEHAGGQRDEAFGRDLRWRHTFLLYSWQRGNLDNDLRPISEDRAVRLTDQIRRQVTTGRPKRQIVV
ncbi:MAG TPA: hypothetical protein VMU95_13655 [Trebonia sp.]|nr:hypothetical protein [Trebonia sp.]